MKYYKEFKLWFPDTEKRPDKSFACLEKYREDWKYPVSLIPRAHETLCVQAGGHVGYWPRMFAEVFAQVYTFEPDPDCYAALAKNVEKFSNVTAFNFALGRNNGKELFRSWSSRTGTAAMAVLGAGGDVLTEVKTQRLDDMQLENLALVYLDVEGYEPDILYGAAHQLAVHRPVVVCEMLERSREKIKKVLEGFGYFPVPNKMNMKCRDQTFIHRDDKRYRRCVT